MPNKRIFYAVQSVAVAQPGSSSYTAIHGLQSVGINTKFNLEQIFEIGQISLYQNYENIPDVEVTLEKCLDGYPLIYHLCTKGATSATLVGRSNQRSTIGLSIFTDTQQSASGTPVAQCVISGVFVSALNYDFTVQGPFREQVTLVGNNKTWLSSFTAPTFNNTDSPLAITGSGGVQHRQDLIMGEASGPLSLFPADIPGITSSGTCPYDTVNDIMAVHFQSVKTSVNLGRDALYELGRRGVYHRYAQFPTEVKTDFEVISTKGDQVEAYENTATTQERRILLVVREGTQIDLGTHNRLTSVTYGGANAGTNGGNATDTYSYSTWSDMTVTHPQDPSGL